MSLSRNPQAGFETRIRHIAAAGVELPGEIALLRERQKQFQRKAGGHTARDMLAAAVANGEDDLGLLWAAAVAEASATPGLTAEVTEHVRLHVNRAIRSAYAQVADDVYRQVAAQFDTAAATLTTAHSVVDCELPADEAITLPQKQQQAWRTAATAVADLNRLQTSLKAAAVLAELCGDDAELDLPLCVDPGEAPRRDIWHAWETDHREAAEEKQARNGQPFTVAPATRSRTGKWGAVLKAGGSIRANPGPVEPYRRAKQLVERLVHQDGRNVRITLDPESPDYEPPQPQRVGLPLPSTRVRVHG